ncbi:hypothetical protein V6N12_075586 [Hibiscus sabdariffa]|uniref:Uncharacterized protein n=1 Tax=Hibiscus sabdariffa TaxID=183260 RepID=A0ABR2C8P5_9ROSI
MKEQQREENFKVVEENHCWLSEGLTALPSWEVISNLFFYCPFIDAEGVVVHCNLVSFMISMPPYHMIQDDMGMQKVQCIISQSNVVYMLISKQKLSKESTPKAAFSKAYFISSDHSASPFLLPSPNSFFDV